MLHSTCPSMRLNGTSTDAPRSLEELMKGCILLKPKLDSHYFLELGENPFHKLYRGTNQDIILTKYAHQPSQPPPSTQTGFSSQMFLKDSIEELDRVVPGTQIENPLPSIGPPPSKETPIVEESQSLPQYNRNILLLISSDSEQSEGDTEVGLPFTERQESPQPTQECEDGVKESLTQAFTHNESFSNNEKTSPLLIRTDEQNLSTNTLTENQQTQDSDSFFNNLDTILFHYTEQMQMQSQSKSSPIKIQDDTPLVSMGPSNNLQSSVIIESPNTNTGEYSSECEYSSSESDSGTLSSQHSASSNLITGETATDLHAEHKAICIGNRTSPNFKPKRIKLTKTSPEEKGILTHRKQEQQNTHKLITDIFKKPKPVQHKPWTTQEEQLLVIGVSKYGTRWKKIHTALNLSSSRSLSALTHKYTILKKNGEYYKYLREFRKNAGYKSNDQSEPEESNSDKDDRVNEEQTQSVIPLYHDKWTYQEKENLVIGVERYGLDWNKIHSSFYFSSSRPYSSLITKHREMRMHGEYDQILLSYGKKVARGILPDNQVPTDKVSSAIPRETTTNSNVLKATSDRLTNPANSKQTTLHDKSLSHATPKRKCRDVISNLDDSNLFYWTRNEINNLIRGYERFQNDWNAILKNYTFNPRRTVRSLSNKHQTILKRSGDSFYNDIQDPYFLPSK